VSLPGIGISLADALYEKGFFSAEELSNASVEDLIRIRGIAEGKAKQLIDIATNYMSSIGAIDETSKEVLPDDETDDEIPAVSDVQEVLKENIDSDEDASGHSSSEDNAAKDD
jgi:N utilization substance protein A